MLGFRKQQQQQKKKEGARSPEPAAMSALLTSPVTTSLLYERPSFPFPACRASSSSSSSSSSSQSRLLHHLARPSLGTEKPVSLLNKCSGGTQTCVWASNRFNSNSYNNNNEYYDEIEVDMDPEKMLKPGDPNTFQATIRKAMPVGYWVTMPSGREAFLPAQDLGFLGGLEKLRQIFQPGQEVTVRVVTRGGSGREVLSLKKPDPNKPDPPPRPLRKDFEGGRRRRPAQYS